MNDTASSTDSSINSSCSPYDAKIYSVVAAVSVVSSFMSLLSSLFIIFTIILFKKLRFFSQRLVFYLAITAAVLSVSYIFLRVDYEQQTGASYSNFCMFSGFLNQISSWMVLNAVTTITLSLLIRTFFKRRPEAFERMLLLFIFVFPFTFNWIPFIKLAYGKSGAWCWIRSLDETTCEWFTFGLIMQLLLWYLPLYVMILAQIILYIMIIAKLYCYKKKRVMDMQNPEMENNRQQITKEAVSLLAYPVIYFIINIFPLINHIYGAVRPTNPSPVLWFLSGIFLPLQGGIIALAFSLDPQTRKRLNLASFKASFGIIYLHRKTSAYEYPMPIEAKSDSLKQGLLNE